MSKHLGATAKGVRNRIRSGALSPDEALPVIEEALRISPSVQWWTLRGDLIQLSDGTKYHLEDALRSYETAHALDPSNPEPLEELGRFYDTVMNDPDKARQYFYRALANGAGESCAEALAALDSENT